MSSSDWLDTDILPRPNCRGLHTSRAAVGAEYQRAKGILPAVLFPRR